MIVLSGLVTDTGRPNCDRLMIGELDALAGLPPTASDTDNGPRSIIGDALGLPDGRVSVGIVCVAFSPLIIPLRGLVIDRDKPRGDRSTIGEFVALAGFPFPPTARDTLSGFKLISGDALEISVGPLIGGAVCEAVAPFKIPLRGLVIDRDKPKGDRSTIGEFVALAGFPLPPTAREILSGFKLIIGDALELPDVRLEGAPFDTVCETCPPLRIPLIEVTREGRILRSIVGEAPGLTEVMPPGKEVCEGCPPFRIELIELPRLPRSTIGEAVGLPDVMPPGNEVCEGCPPLKTELMRFSSDVATPKVTPEEALGLEEGTLPGKPVCEDCPPFKTELRRLLIEADIPRSLPGVILGVPDVRLSGRAV